MAAINLRDKEVQVKIVYYGPGRGGKTTNLEYIFSKLKHRTSSDMVVLKTHGDRTLYFDFLPFDLGKVRGFDVKVQLYTVPGQTKYDATRKVVLRGVDGVVFVADSLVARRRSNMLSLKNLQKNLGIYKLNIFKIPLVLQYNKRDMARQGVPVLPFEILQKDLNSQLMVPSFEASALRGENVVATLKKIMLMTMDSLQKELK